MKIANPYARILPLPGHQTFTKEDGDALLRRIEWCARISHRSEEAEPDTERFLRSVVLNHGDWSVVEHASVSVEFYVDRGVTHEEVRHRLFSFTQESTRFVNYVKKMLPEFMYPRPDDLTLDPDWLEAIEFAEEKYQALIAKGWKPQEARSVFPTALASKIIVTGNLRNWRHFFLMRTTKEAHPQMRQVTWPLLKEFKEKIFIFFEDIEPGAKQADNIRKGR